MYFVYFSWWRNQNFRVPSSTKVKVATAGRAFGVWNDKDSTFKFKLPAGVCTADVSFMGTTGIHEFHFTTDSAEASHCEIANSCLLKIPTPKFSNWLFHNSFCLGLV